jgi:hypothetical protein
MYPHPCSPLPLFFFPSKNMSHLLAEKGKTPLP